MNGVEGGASHDDVEQAPVGAPLNGSWQGTHFEPAAQVDCSSEAWAATAGKQVDRHLPAAVVPAKAAQAGGRS